MLEMPPLPTTPPVVAGETETLRTFLDYQRGVVLRKIAGLSVHDLSKPMTPTGLSLLGVVKHLADVEAWWFRAVLIGEDVTFASSEEDPDGDFRIDPDDTLEGIAGAYRDAVARANEILDGTGPEQLSVRPVERLGGPVGVRWILVHMIEETARHLGHMDLMREMFDRSTGD